MDKQNGGYGIGREGGTCVWPPKNNNGSGIQKRRKDAVRKTIVLQSQERILHARKKNTPPEIRRYDQLAATGLWRRKVSKT